jgi:hypothetical protein
MGGRDNSWVSNLKFLAKDQKWQQLKFSGLLQGKFILEGCLHTPFEDRCDDNSEGYNLIDQILNLFFRDHKFEFYKTQDYWRLIWLLTSGPVRLIKVHVS